VSEGAYDVAAQVSGKTVPAVGAPAFTAAPVLTPGRYSDSILVGETLLYGVELDWGEQLVCDVSFGRSPAVDRGLGFHTPTAAVRVYGPSRIQLADLSFNAVDNDFYEADKPVGVHVATPPVRYQNRTAGPYASAASLPGTYYCGAMMNGDAQYASAGEIPVELTVDVVGRAGEGAPEYDEGATAVKPAAGSSEERRSTPVSSGQGPENDGTPWWVWVLLGALVLAAGVFAALRRRATGSPDEAG
jgi:Ca-activated chloride channel family protein